MRAGATDSQLVTELRRRARNGGSQVLVTWEGPASGWSENDPRVPAGEWVLTELSFGPPEATGSCRHCSRPISKRAEKWTHDRGGMRGCRAASFTSTDGWDESLERHWRAAPTR